MKRVHIVSFVVAVFLSAGVAFLSLWRLRESLEEAHWVAHTHEVMSQINAVQVVADELQTGLRGFVLTGDDAFLAPHTSASARVADESRRLLELLADDPARAARAATTAGRIRDYADFSTGLVELRRRDGLDAAIRAISAGTGREMLVAIRSELAALRVEEERLLAARSVESESGARLSMAVIAAAGAVSLALLGAVFTLLRRLVRERERQFTDSLDLMAVADLDGYFKRVNPAWTRALGWTAAEMTSGPWLDFVHPDDRQPTLAASAGLARGLDVVTFENRYRHKDGSWRWLAWHTPAPRPGETTLFASARDVTELHRLQSELERRQALLAAIMDATTELVAVKDVEGRYTYLNAAALTVLGGPANRFIGRKTEEVLPPERSSVALARDQAALARGSFATSEENWLFNGATRLMIATRGPLLEGGRPVGTISIHRDVTELRQHERELAQVNEKLHAANQELESFSYSVSHDLRAPLRAIDGFARILEEDQAPRLDDDGRRVVGVIRTNARHMGRLIDDLLSFSRAGRTEMSRSRVDMDALVRSVLDELGSPGPGATVGSLPPAHGDASLLRQVWFNLLSNAVKYSSRRPDPRIEVSGAATDREAVYSVKDNGVGFDMQYAPKLFGVFQRLHTREEFEGTGVGLALVQRIVARHGGRVAAEGAVGKGANFSFALPIEGATR